MFFKLLNNQIGKIFAYRAVREMFLFKLNELYEKIIFTYSNRGCFGFF